MSGFGNISGNRAIFGTAPAISQPKPIGFTSAESLEAHTQSLLLQFQGLAKEANSLCSGKVVDVNHFYREIQNLLNHLREIDASIPTDILSPAVQEMKKVLWKEISNIENSLSILTGPETVAIAKRSVSESILNLAVAIKYYTRSMMALVSEMQQQSQAPVHSNRKGSVPINEHIPHEQPAKHTPLSNDTMAFIRECTILSTYLKSKEIERQIILGHLVTILQQVKKLCSDPQFLNYAGQNTAIALTEVTQTIREIQNRPKIDADVLRKINTCLQLLAGIVKDTMISMHKNATVASNNSTETEDTRTSRMNHRQPTTQHSNEPEEAMLRNHSFTQDYDSPFSRNSAHSLRTSTLQKKSSNRKLSELSGSIDFSGSMSSLDQADIPHEPLNYQHEMNFRVRSSKSLEFGWNKRFADPTLIVNDDDMAEDEIMDDYDGQSSTLFENISVTNVNPSNGDYIVELGVMVQQDGVITKIQFTKTLRDCVCFNRELMSLYPKDNIPLFQGLKSSEVPRIKHDLSKLFDTLNKNVHLLRSQELYTFLSENCEPLDVQNTPQASSQPPVPKLNIEQGLQRRDTSASSLNAASTNTSPTAVSKLVDSSTKSTASPKSDRSSATKGIFSFFKNVTAMKQSKTASMSIQEQQALEEAGLKAQAQLDNFAAETMVVKTSGSPRKSQALAGGAQREAPIKSFDQFCDLLKNHGFVRKGDSVSLSENGKEVLILKNKAGNAHVVAGTPVKLFWLVLFEEYREKNFQQCFLLMYRTFMKPAELLLRVIEFYKNGSMDIESKHQAVIRFMETWIGYFWDDFTGNVPLITALSKFIEVIETSEFGGESIRQKFNEQNSKLPIQRSSTIQQPQENAIISNIGAMDFMSVNLEVFAKQLTKIDSELFLDIKQTDLIRQIWEKSPKIPAVDDWIARFNQISYWVGTEICTVPLLKNRIGVLENMIKLLKHVRDLNNYNCVMAIISGLNISSTRRLKKTWDGVSSKHMSILHEIEKAMDPNHNYQSYRDIESKKKLPFIPFLGLYLKDLTFANDGNSKTLESGLINFEKAWGVLDIVDKVAQFQSVPHQIEKDAEVYDYCGKLIALPEKRLYKYSLLCEPRVNAESGERGSMRLIEKWAKR